MTLAYFDCFAGAGGDMIVASLLDAGADLDTIAPQLASLGLDGYELRAETVHPHGLSATRFHVDVAPGPQPHRHLHHILDMIDAAALPDRAADRARRIFTRLGEAEAAVHGCSIEQVHFHEVGAVDSIVDVVGACLAMEQLGIDRLMCGPVPLGTGTITCDHGVLPVPAPATARLPIGAATIPGERIVGEATTPTAAAIFTTLTERYGPVPAMTIARIGCGAGTREGKEIPNILRVFLGEDSARGQVDSAVELSANIDDCTGEVLGATLDRLLGMGCLDAWASPITMKKSRPAWTVSALCLPSDVRAAEELLFAETTTFGVRRRDVSRTKLQRSFETVETPYGPVRVKVGRLDGRVVTAAPEFDDCNTAAASHHTPVRDVLAAAMRSYHSDGGAE